MIAVRDYTSYKPVCVTNDDVLAKARSLIRKRGFRALPVLDSKTSKLVGIISRSDILRVTSSRTNLKVGGLMNKNVVTVSIDDDLLSVVKLFVKYHIRQTPVLDRSKNLVGIISALDLLGALIKNGIVPSKGRIKEIMSVDVVSCHPEDNITLVWEKMLSTGFSGLPVTDDKKKVVGIITRMDLLKHGSARPHKEAGKNKHVPVKKLMQSKVTTVLAGDDIQKVSRLMSEKRIIRLPVVDSGMKLFGIVDIEDILRSYIQ